jgi:hypothetical protein
MIVGVLYTIMMKGFCNVALYRLEQSIINGDCEQLEGDTEDGHNSDEPAESLSGQRFGMRSDEGSSKLQWAARMQTGYEGNLTPHQEKVLNELREDLEKTHVDDWKLCASHPDGPDRIMLRFLRAECSGKARRFNLEKSRLRLIETLRFRQAM